MIVALSRSIVVDEGGTEAILSQNGLPHVLRNGIPIRKGILVWPFEAAGVVLGSEVLKCANYYSLSLLLSSERVR